MVDAEGKPAGWRGWIGVGDVRYGSAPKESTLEVVDTLEQLRDKVPAGALRHGRPHRPPADRRGPRHLRRRRRRPSLAGGAA